MPHAVAFNTHTYVKQLESAGFSEKQAEIQANALLNIIDENLATKRDIELIRHDMKELEVALKHDMKELEIAFKHDIELVRRDMKEMELKFDAKFKRLDWLGSIILTGIASLVLKAFFMP